MKPVTIGDATLYCGDCLDVLRMLPANSIEACLTDPPYGLSNHTDACARVAHVSPDAFTVQPSPGVKAEPAQGSLL